LNAFNEALYDATTQSLIDAARSPDVAVVVPTGNGRAFSAGTDVVEMAARTADPESFTPGVHGFPGLIDQLAAFPKPLLCAVNGMALGIGATLLGFADLVFMSSEARIRCPFTDLAVAPEAAAVAAQLAAKPLASLIESKRTIVGAYRDGIAAARKREDVAFRRLLRQPANLEAFAALAGHRPPDFVGVDTANPVDVDRHRSDAD
jgi:enoyl-CoA hydratase/carnithine racemase